MGDHMGDVQASDSNAFMEKNQGSKSQTLASACGFTLAKLKTPTSFCHNASIRFTTVVRKLQNLQCTLFKVKMCSRAKNHSNEQLMNCLCFAPFVASRPSLSHAL